MPKIAPNSSMKGAPSFQNMALPPTQNGTTANLEAEFNGLLRLSKRLCMQALAWKLLGQLESRKVGTAEVEAWSSMNPGATDM